MIFDARTSETSYHGSQPARFSRVPAATARIISIRCGAHRRLWSVRAPGACSMSTGCLRPAYMKRAQGTRHQHQLGRLFRGAAATTSIISISCLRLSIMKAATTRISASAVSVRATALIISFSFASDFSVPGSGGTRHENQLPVTCLRARAKASLVRISWLGVYIVARATACIISICCL